MTSRIALPVLLALACARTETTSTQNVSAERKTATIASSSTMAPPIAPDAINNEPMAVGGEVTAPILVKKVEPQFPEMVSSEVFWLFSMVVTKEGHISDLELVKGTAGSYSRAAETAIKQWQFKPATYRGRAVDVKYNLSVRMHPR